MCIKMLSKQDIIDINKEFDKGNVVNESSLEYTLSILKNTNTVFLKLGWRKNFFSFFNTLPMPQRYNKMGRWKNKKPHRSEERWGK